ncbi:MAG: uroporphyrinogen-III C-methyltransferase [Pseudomonadota bacterium]
MTMPLMEEKKEEAKIIRPRSWLWLNIMLIVLMFLLVGAGVGFYYAKVQQMTQTIAQLHVQTMQVEQAHVVEAAALNELQATLKDQSNQLEQQQRSLQHLSLYQQQRQWQLDEIRYLIHVANTSLIFSRDAKASCQLLGQVHTIILVMQDPSFDILDQAVLSDIKVLAALTLQDASQLFLQVTTLDQAIDAMPLLGSGFSNENEPPEDISSVVHTWRERLKQTLHQLQYVVDVRKTSNSLSPLIAQEQGEYINQYLHMQLGQAQWALLYNNNEIYQASLEQVNLWINRYFVILNPKTQDVLAALSALQAIDIRFPDVNLEKTLAALKEISP